MSLAGFFSKVPKNCFMKSTFDNCKTIITRGSRLWEPDYLILAKTKTPEYDLINIQLKGYDFAILDQYRKLIRKLALSMNINVTKTWPAPQQDLLIHLYKVNSTEIEHKYNLKFYERNVQVVDVKSHIMPLFIETIITACPPGVNVSVHQHEDYMEEDRYIPNKDVLELKMALEEVGSTKKKKKVIGARKFK